MSESVIHYGLIIYKYNIYVLQSNKKSGPKIFLDIKRLRKTASSIPLLEEARIKSDWAIRLSDVISPVDAARIGTAGYTAMLCVQVQYLEHSVSDPYSIESGSSQKSQSGSSQESQSGSGSRRP